MGLDMYLSTNSKRVAKAANKATNDEPWRIASGTAIYWRKANAIHNWFVEHVQYGRDDCNTYEVEVEQLIELRDTCKEVIEHSKLVPGTIINGTVNGRPNYEPGMLIEDASKAEELLPTTEGFFFGSTEYNEWYLDDLKRTVAGIDAILDNIEQYERNPFGDVVWKDWREKGETDDWNVMFTYCSSW